MPRIIDTHAESPGEVCRSNRAPSLFLLLEDWDGALHGLYLGIPAFGLKEAGSTSQHTPRCFSATCASRLGGLGQLVPTCARRLWRTACLEHVLKDTWGPPAHAPAILGPGNPRKSAQPFAWILSLILSRLLERTTRKAQNPPTIHREFLWIFPVYN